MNWVLIWLLLLLIICIIGISLLSNEVLEDIKSLKNSGFVNFYKLYKDIKFNLLGIFIMSFTLGFLILYLLLLIS